MNQEDLEDLPTVLIVDDHFDLRESLRLVLEANELRVVAATADAHDAVSLAVSLDPDVVLVDVRMPQIGGPELIRRMIDEGCHAEIIGLSMSDDPYTRQKVLEAGATDFAYKGDPWRALARKIRRAVERRHRHSDPEQPSGR